MANAIAPANISLNLVNEEFWTCGHSNTVNGEHLEYVLGQFQWGGTSQTAPGSPTESSELPGALPKP